MRLVLSQVFINPLHSSISIHNLLTFLKELTRRICSKIKSFFQSWWSFCFFLVTINVGFRRDFVGRDKEGKISGKLSICRNKSS